MNYPVLPLDRMRQRVEAGREDSDVTYFFNLLYIGEMITKLTAAGLIAALSRDRDNHRYRLIHRLVRADGLGEWNSAIHEVLFGPASQHLSKEARTEQRDLTRIVGHDSWQYTAVSLLNRCVRKVDPSAEEIPTRIAAERWFSQFVNLRNRTRGHGAPTSATCSEVCLDLAESVFQLATHFTLFQRPWAYLHRNLSGKYRVTRWTNHTTGFGQYRSKPCKIPLADGVYVHFEEAAHVELVRSDPDASDFAFPNGRFDGQRYELISYITDDRAFAEAKPYLLSPGVHPASETQGLDQLDVQGQSFGNVPPPPDGYVDRPDLQNELLSVIMDNRHPAISLTGRGGIGKTSLALSVLRRVMDSGKFQSVLWFSARDIDLYPTGPKTVRPQVVTKEDIAAEMIRLIAPVDAPKTRTELVGFLAEWLASSPMAPMLFVFDNFETVRSPADLYSWLNERIRLPNKILITTRHREFRGDYYVEVRGMSERECEELIQSTARHLNIANILTKEYTRALYNESDGHPYVVKILLGDLARAGRMVNFERVVAGRDDILDALFDRTYTRFSKGARRAFLTLCNWRSLVPQIALEAVLLRPSNERINIEEALEELQMYSFIEVHHSPEEGMPFLNVPLAASIFGRKKLAVSPMKTCVEADTIMLHDFGVTRISDLRRGIGLPIERLFKKVAERICKQPEVLSEYDQLLGSLARRFPPAWLQLADLFEEWDQGKGIERAKDAVRSFLETSPTASDCAKAWHKLAHLCRRSQDVQGEISALIELCTISNTEFSTLSSVAGLVNAKLFYKELGLQHDEKQVLVRRLISIIDRRKGEADSNACSKVAWLCLLIRDEKTAREYTELGLELDHENEHCIKLAARLGVL